MVHQHRKVNCDPHTNNRISRPNMEYSAEHQVPSNAQNRKNYYSTTQDPKKKLVVMAHSQNYSRKHKFCVLCCTNGKTTLQTNPNRSQYVARKRQEQEIPASTTRNKRTTVVARKCQHTISHSPQGSNNIHNHRCIQPRMGSDSERHTHKRHLEQGTTILAQQFEGVMDAAKSHRNVDSRSPGSNNFGADGQQNGSRLHQQRRWNKIIDTVTVDYSHTSGGSSQQVTSHRTLLTRKVQPISRQPIQISTDARMDPVKPNIKGNIRQTRHSNDRSVCKLAIGGCGSVCVRGCPGPRLCLRERVQQTLALPTRLAFPSSTPHTTSPTASGKELRKISVSGPEMGENLLESGTTPKSPVPTIDDIQPTPSPGRSTDRETTTGCRDTRFAGMEGSGWTRLVGSWHENERTLLESAWRKSTLKTYGVAWEKWRAWSKDKCAVDNPEPSDLARFMSYLHNETKLAPSTIAVHKSVVSTFANPVKSEALSGHPVVRQMMKAISVTKPPCRKPTTWDVSKLIEYLQHYDIDVESIFQVSRHVAALLLLCSGRRIHDLTLLDISSEFFEDANDHIVLWPKFGSKTDSSTYRQAGWRLSNDGNDKLNPVVWIKKLISLSQKRRNARQNLSSLFITTRGKVNAASRTVIAGWLRTLFREANIQDSPGSFRAAVNSDMWSNHHINIDEILARGNWRSKDTFIKHYCKELQRSQSSANENLFRLFKPT